MSHHSYSQVILITQQITIYLQKQARFISIPHMQKQQIQFHIEGYKIIKIIGEGAFGTILRVQKLNSQQQYVCKMEKPNKLKQILVEIEYNLLKAVESTKLFPKVYELVKQKDKSYIIMDLLSLDLQKLKQEKGKISMKSTALLTQQLFKIVQCLHNHNYLHRDFKPQNILISNSSHSVYLIDYGLSKQCKKPPNRMSGMIGNVRYASIQAHLGYSSKKDDLQSLCYVILYLFVGRLPWQTDSKIQIEREINRVNNNDSIPQQTPLWGVKKRVLKIEHFEIKNYHEIEKAFLQQLINLTEKIKKMQSNEIPDYSSLNWIIKKLLFISGGFENDCFDWCNPHNCPYRRSLKDYKLVYKS